MNIAEELIEFLNKAHSEYQAIDLLKKELLKNEFVELSESENFEVKKGGKYFVSRNLTSLIAFKIGEKIDSPYFKIVASHPDSPAFKIKENPVLIENKYEKLKVEGYGGMIISPWLDKPLGIAGRIMVETKNGIESRLVDTNKAVAIIPNVAIHQNREINNGFKYNIQVDLCPILGSELPESTHYEKILNTFINKDEKIFSTDLYLYNYEKSQLLGEDLDLITSPKLDDLASDFTTLKGFIDAKNADAIDVFAALNNEEVGSLSISGADSTFLSDILKRIMLSLEKDDEEYYKAIARSVLISSDNAHAVHPNHPELSDNNNLCYLNEGVVIKHNSNMLYTTDALSSSIIKKLCSLNNLKYQEFFNRSDVRGGSTLGNISNSHVSLVSADIGIPQLAMHSNYEVCGAKDIENLYELIKEFMARKIVLKQGSVKIS